MLDKLWLKAQKQQQDAKLAEQQTSDWAEIQKAEVQEIQVDTNSQGGKWKYQLAFQEYN